MNIHYPSPKAALAGSSPDLQSDRVFDLLRHCPLYKPTPLIDCQHIAARLGVKAILAKYESSRLGLTSFKALGGAYAILRHVIRAFEDQTSRSFTHRHFNDPAFRKIAAGLTFTAATDGNHGLSVAAGASVIGSRAVIFVHERVPQARIQRLKNKGAEVRTVPGVFDDAVAMATQTANSKNWVLIPDTTDQPQNPVCQHVMEGYTMLAAEMNQQSSGMGYSPTHSFLQCGVGGLAAACAAEWSKRPNTPQLIMVEPDQAPALFESAKARQPVSAKEGPATNMEMLECFTPSRPAWDILWPITSAFMLVDDHAAKAAVKTAQKDDIKTTPSGAAGLAGLIAAVSDPDAKERLNLDRESVVWLVVSEGALAS